MAGFLFAEEGPLAGLIIRLEEGEEWVIGRDPEVSFQVLEDPMVSRKHLICRLTDEGYEIENLSSVNPAHINGKPILEPALLHEGDIVQIGSTFFHFTEKDPARLPTASRKEEPLEESIPPESPPYFEEEGFEALSLEAEKEARWIIKVVSGPNAGAEFPLLEGKSYILGKDPAVCDILFQDLTVSREHAKISLDEEGKVLIEDLNSRNGVLVNRKLVKGPKKLESQDLITLGTTAFLVIDRQQIRETIYSPPPLEEEKVPGELPPAEAKEKAIKSLREMVIPYRHLVLAALFMILLFLGISGMITLFKSKAVVVVKKDEKEEIKEALKQFPSVEFSYNISDGKLFLLGHVLTEVDYQELLYLLQSLPFIDAVEDNIVVDELVWENMNALFIKEPNWRSVSMAGSKPGRFILRGYLQTSEDLAQLTYFINLNFPYTDKLENQVAVEQTLQTQIQALLMEKGFVNVTFQLTDGELILAGRVQDKLEKDYTGLVDEFKKIKGIRVIKNFVIFTTASTARIDITDKYTVTGNSKFGKINQFIVINGKILSTRDSIDGMMITAIEPSSILLEKDGLKYKIDYNQQ